MYALDYKKLLAITQTVQPYRGSTNRFPLRYRSQNTKYFLAEELNGEQVFRIVYGNRFRSIPMTYEEYKEYVDAGCGDYYDRDEYDDKGNKIGKLYYRYHKSHNDLGIVRADNTFEFTKDSYYQGEKQIMSGWCNGVIYSSSRHGGMVYKEYGSGDKHFHPIWKGMRVDCMSFKPTQDYRVVGKRVSRKDGKQYLDSYKDFYKASEVMMKAMDDKSFIQMSGDVLKESGVLSDMNQGWYVSIATEKKLVERAISLMHDAPLDATALYCIAYDLDNMWRRAQHAIDPTMNQWYGRGDIDVANMFIKMKRNINKSLYKANPDVMKTVEFPMGLQYPASEWGYELIVDGNKVDQYE